MVVLHTQRLSLRFPKSSDIGRFEDFHARNLKHFKPWESTAEHPMSFAEALELWERECTEKSAARFFFFERNDPQEKLLGICNFSPIFRGPFQACFLGYKIDKEYEGQGMMTEALQKGIEYVFEKLNLHRVMAAYVPTNVRSGNVLKRLGFTVEGYARDYLIINGRWQDHILTALVNQNWKSFL